MIVKTNALISTTPAAAPVGEGPGELCDKCWTIRANSGACSCVG